MNLGLVMELRPRDCWFLGQVIVQDTRLSYRIEGRAFPYKITYKTRMCLLDWRQGLPVQGYEQDTDVSYRPEGRAFPYKVANKTRMCLTGLKAVPSRIRLRTRHICVLPAWTYLCFCFPNCRDSKVTANRRTGYLRDVQVRSSLTSRRTICLNDQASLYCLKDFLVCLRLQLLRQSPA